MEKRKTNQTQQKHQTTYTTRTPQTCQRPKAWIYAKSMVNG